MNKKIKVGIVGLGRAGRLAHAKEVAKYPELFEITAGCDRADDRRKDLSPEFDKARVYASFDELLADPNVELVSIATRHPDHVPMALKALDAGKYVVVEKPCAVSYDEMRALTAQNEKRPGRIFLRHNRRFEAAFQKTQELLKTGVLGKVSMIKLYRHVGYCRRNDWMTMSQFAGGLLTNWGPHLVDQALQLLGSPVVDCWADLKSCICIGDADDQVKILLKAANGCVADIEITGTVLLEGRNIEVWGERGTLVFGQQEAPGVIRMRYVDPAIAFNPLKPHPENPPMQYGNFEETLRFVDQRVDLPVEDMSVMWVHVHRAIREGVPYPITVEHGAEVVRITDLVLKKSGFVPKAG